jgi:hypothetical protein
MSARIKNIRLAGCLIGVLPGLLIFKNASAAEASTFSSRYETNVKTFSVRGVVKEVQADGRTAVIRPGAIQILKAAAVKDKSPVP